MAAEKAKREAEEWERQKARMQEALEAESAKVVKVCEETRERIEETNEIPAATPPAELPSVIKIAASSGPIWPTPEATPFPRDHFAQEIQGEIVDVKHGEIHHAKSRFFIHPSNSTISLVAGIDELHTAINQWIDEAPDLGDELKIRIVEMLDSEYEDIMSAGGL
jgi:hypothetical protein